MEGGVDWVLLTVVDAEVVGEKTEKEGMDVEEEIA